MKTALGMIVRSIDTDEEIMRFIENAEKYGHKLDCVIAAYSQRIDPDAAEKIDRKVPFFPINVIDPSFCVEEFRRRGMSQNAFDSLLECPVDSGFGLVPYGFNRTIVTIEAILRGADILFFVDNDVYPSFLDSTTEGFTVRDMDFFGSHLRSLNSGSMITTGEYSGYNILPPASFEGMEDLLLGLQKGDMLEYWQNSRTHRSITARPLEPEIVPCTKILGGNTAITLSAFQSLPPFFSSSYIVDDELYLNRGEDTVLGLGIAKSGLTCTEIGLYPMHDTYKNYPDEPDLQRDPEVQDRFFYACTGWVGRNPFYNYLLGNDIQSVREFQRERLERGLAELVKYTSNPRFSNVLRNFEVSWDSLGRYVSEFEQVLEAWDEFRERSDLL